MKKNQLPDKLDSESLPLWRIYFKIALYVLVLLTICLIYINISNDYTKLKNNNSNAITGYLNKISDFSETDNVKKQLELVIKENEELKKQYQEVLEDNLYLQNSLKIAAKAGIKPQRYSNPPNITSRSFLDRSRYVGMFIGTAYTPSPSECKNSKGITYSGKPIIPGLTIAVDTHYWPIGTVFYIKGLGYVTAMDTGSKVKGKNRFDFAVFDKKFAYALGKKSWEVYLVKRGDGRVDLDMFKDNQIN